MVYTIGIVIITKFAYDSNLAERLQMLLVHLSRAGMSYTTRKQDYNVHLCILMYERLAPIIFQLYILIP
jgi:hypothetical protein